MNYTRNSYLETAECALCGGKGYIDTTPGMDACPACTRMAEAEWKLARRRAETRAEDDRQVDGALWRLPMSSEVTRKGPAQPQG